MTVQEALVIEAAKAFAAAEADYRVNRTKEVCEKVAPQLAAFHEWVKAFPESKLGDPSPPLIENSCWGKAVEEAVEIAKDTPDGWEQVWPHETWCPACHRNWQKKQDRRRIVNRRIGAIRRLVNAVERLEATPC
jgi:hypothetical protein